MSKSMSHSATPWVKFDGEAVAEAQRVPEARDSVQHRDEDTEVERAREHEEDVHPVDDVEQRAQRPARDVGAEEDAPPQREVLRLDAQPEASVPE